ncbi:MAG: glycosyltransferase [Candidatus Schekmanbacteria bacterium]|nr:glycosyltransferase [Candidatus Schekmanbacteria bacterium]
MKILVISNMYPSENHPSFGVFIKNHIKIFNKENIEYRLIANQIKKGELFLTSLKYFTLIVRTLIISFTAKFDIVHAHFIFPTGIIALIPSYLRRKKLIITAHGGDVNEMPYRNNLLWRLTKFTLNNADKIICVSNDLKEKLNAEFKIPFDKIAVINMGVDTKLFVPNSQSKARIQLGLAKDIKVILYVGNLIKSKGVEYLLKALSLFKNEKTICYIIGSGTEENNLKELCNKLNIENHVEFIGAKPNSDIPMWLSAADILVLPSFSEGVPVVLLEALASGIPCVTSAVGGIPEIIKDGHNGYLINPECPQEIADKINLLLSDKDNYQRIAENCRATVLQHDIRIKVREIKKVYEAVCNC